MRAILLLGLLLLGMQARASFDVFLQITPASGSDVVGTSTDGLYSGWIEAMSFEMGSTNPIQIGKAVTTKLSFRDFTLVKAADRATPEFLSRMGAGQTLSTVKMVIVRRTPSRTELWDVKGSTCFLTKQSITATVGGEALERITFAVGVFESSYTQLSKSGDALSEYFGNWSVLDDTGTKGTRTPTSPGQLDSNSDGILDGWATFYGFDKMAAISTLDSDGDGLDNLHEFIAHTDPLKAQSTFRVTEQKGLTANTYSLTWQSVAGLIYRIETATSPEGPYTNVKSVPSAGDGTTTTVMTVSPAVFYRVVTP